MPVSFSTPQGYDFWLYHSATSIVATGASSIALTPLGIYPENLLGFALKHDEALIPEGDGARDLSDGHLQPHTINFQGQMYAQDQDDLFTDLGLRLSNIALSGNFRYLRAGLYDGTTKQFFRRYGKVLGAEATYARKTAFGIISQFEMAFRALDPFWYYDTAKTGNSTFSASTGGTVALTDTGIARSKRALITIKCTGSPSTSTTYTVTNSSGESFTMTGALAATNDKWVIDMWNCTVTKYTSGGTVAADDIAHFTGQFFGIKNATETLTALSGAARTWNVQADWLERRF